MMIVKLALRYALARRVHAVAVMAVALALTVQIVVMAVLDGMLVDMENRVRDTGEQVTFLFKGDLLTQKEFDRLSAAFFSRPDVTGLSPKIVGLSLAERGGWYAPVEVHGVDLAYEARYGRLCSYLLQLKLDPLAPKWSDENIVSSKPPAFVSSRVAEQLQAKPGDEIVLNFTSDSEQQKIRRKHFVITSTFLSGNPYLDEMGIYIPIEEARQLFYQTDAQLYERVGLWLDDPKRADEIYQQLGDIVLASVAATPAREITVNTWTQRWSWYYESMVHENNLQEIVLTLMNISGGFCVFAILATLVAKRVRDVGLLRCIGATRMQVIGIFVLVGLMTGVVGSALGVAGGYFATPRIDEWYEALTGQPLYPPRMFGIAELTTVIYGWKVAIYAIAATLIATLAALYPALWAGWQEPMEALRDE